MDIRINSLIVTFFKERNIRLVDFKLEFGRYKGEILLGDEISPDGCRLWHSETGEKMDKDRFRFSYGKSLKKSIAKFIILFVPIKIKFIRSSERFG